jgi:hypothetical protein
VKEGLKITDFTIANVPARMAELGEDPLRGVLTDRPDLLGALERLRARVE